MATMVDVCRLAGVSKATVSRVLNNTGPVKESTRQAVFDAIQELSYRPNGLAQALASHRSDTIGLILSNFTGSYFGTLLRQATRSVDAAGKQLIVTDGHDDPKREQDAVNMLMDRRCDAIVLYSRYMPDDQLVQLIRDLPVPLIAMNRYLPEVPDHATVLAQVSAARMATEYLTNLGHRRIACITRPVHQPTSQLRLRGYREALAARGVEVDEAMIEEGTNTVSSGYDACKKLLDRVNFSALVCFTDYMAEGAYRALAEKGLRIPDDVSVFGFDDDPVAAFMVPALSTVHVPIEEMTRKTFEQAIDLAAGKVVAPLVPFVGRLVLRESVSGVGGKGGGEMKTPFGDPA